MFDHPGKLREIRGKYKEIESEDEEEEELKVSCFATYKQDSRTIKHVSFSIILLLAFLISMSAGFIAGKTLPKLTLSVSDFLIAPAGNIKHTWHYNKTFSESPSDQTEAAWLSIFPQGRGFFSHPNNSANISGIALFHELHCLNGIRLAYYGALNKTHHGEDTSNEDAAVDAANAHNDPHHIRHCFDYLRQALMCAADTNIEQIDWKLGGSTGWGFERKCRDYDKVVKWAERWRVHSQKDIS